MKILQILFSVRKLIGHPEQNSNLHGRNQNIKQISDTLFDCVLFELMLYVPVKSNGHVGTLPPFYGTFTQH